jgi:hypothetical protein
MDPFPEHYNAGRGPTAPGVVIVNFPVRTRISCEPYHN